MKLELIARFFHGADPWTFVGKTHWDDVLGDKVERVIERLREDGALIQAPPELAIRKRYSETDLRYLLGERGLDSTGTPEEMIDRLVTADAEGVRMLAAEINILVPSDEARGAVARYVKAERARRVKTENVCLADLHQRNFLRAALTVGEFQKDSVFSRRAGVSFSDDDQLENVEILKKLFEHTPRLLAAFDAQTLDGLRPAAGMAFLWGKESAAPWVSESLRVDGRLDAVTVCAMLISHARHLQEVENYRGARYNAFEIWSRNDDDTCTACRELRGKLYSLDSLPELPHAQCSSTHGCRCKIVVSEYSH
ncbi:MAG: hypothetical protein IH600_05505 [Bacteroidetes bacterium]|nr:hypothetical protein [Bacteroidota bacterium]